MKMSFDSVMATIAEAKLKDKSIEWRSACEQIMDMIRSREEDTPEQKVPGDSGPTRVIVTIQGGTYQGHISDGPVDLDILDYDTMDQAKEDGINGGNPSAKKEYDELLELEQEAESLRAGAGNYHKKDGKSGQLLKKALYALNMVPNKPFYYQEKKTSTYELASEIEKHLSVKSS